VLQNTGKESLLLKALPRKAVLEAWGFKPSFSIKIFCDDRQFYPGVMELGYES